MMTKAYRILPAIVIALISLVLLPLEILSILFGALVMAIKTPAGVSKFGIFWEIWGNDEDPSPPNWYMPALTLDSPGWVKEPEPWRRIFMWYLRNPHHNLQWHVIGVVGRQFTRTGDYPTQIWNPNGGWNFAVIHYRRVFLPFVSYRGKSVEFYLGWRESGAFGRALRKANAK